MKLVGVLSTVLLLATPVVASAQGHGGMGFGAGRAGLSNASMAHGGGANWGHSGPGRGGGFRGRGFDHHDRGFHDHGLLWGWGPYWGWGWSDCSAYGDACDWGHESSAGDPSDDYGYTEGPPTNAACGAWLRHGAGYLWTRRVCGDDPPAADPPPHGAVAANECSDWVWRADLHRSVCKRTAHAVG